MTRADMAETVENAKLGKMRLPITISSIKAASTPETPADGVWARVCPKPNRSANTSSILNVAVMVISQLNRCASMACCIRKLSEAQPVEPAKDKGVSAAPTE